MSKNDGGPKTALQAARAFTGWCLRVDFFKDTDRARRKLSAVLASPYFSGTESCREFLLVFDIRGVGYNEDDPALPDVSPQEWLEYQIVS